MNRSRSRFCSFFVQIWSCPDLWDLLHDFLMYQNMWKSPFNIRFHKKISPQLGLEPTKMRQYLKKSVSNMIEREENVLSFGSHFRSSEHFFLALRKLNQAKTHFLSHFRGFEPQLRRYFFLKSDTKWAFLYILIY